MTMPTSRRAVLGAGAALAALANPLAAQANPDAELLATCARHIVNMQAFCAGSDMSDFENDPLWLAYEATRDAISNAEPKTMAGLLAIAHVAKAEASNPDGSEDHENCPASDWAWLILNVLLRQHDGAA